MSYYKKTFQQLIGEGVPKWYIRSYLLDALIHFPRLYVYCDIYDVETQEGWYATNGLNSNSTPADRNRKCYGSIVNHGFPDWNDYLMLYEGDEYDHPRDFGTAYERHREGWISEYVGERSKEQKNRLRKGGKTY